MHIFKGFINCIMFNFSNHLYLKIIDQIKDIKQMPNQIMKTYFQFNLSV